VLSSPRTQWPGIPALLSWERVAKATGTVGDERIIPEMPNVLLMR